MFEKTYQNMYKQIAPSERLNENILEQAQQPVKRKEKRRKAILITAAMFFLIGASTTVVAIPIISANVPPFYEWIFKYSSKTTQVFKTVHKGAEQEGIRIELISVSTDGGGVHAYLAVQDVLGKNRIDETVTVQYQVLSVSGKGEEKFLAGSYGEELVVYDPKEQTAIISLEYFPHKSATITNKLIFDIHHIKSGSAHYEGVPVKISLSQLPTESKQYMKATEGVGSGGNAGYRKKLEKIGVLKPTKPIFADEHTKITGMDYKNDLLHIQFEMTDLKATDDVYGWYLEDKNGNRKDNVFSTWFTFEGKSYEEWIFKVTKAELAEYKLYGNFIKNQYKIDGDWRIDFSLITQE